MKTIRASISLLVFAAPLATAGFYGCGDDSVAPVSDGGSTKDALSSTDGTVAQQDGSTAGDAASHDGSTGNDAAVAMQKAVVTKLFSDQDGGAAGSDPNLVNAWGLVFGPTGVAWVSDNGTGVLTLYPAGSPTPSALVVTVPAPQDAGTAAPTGQVFNGTTDFMGDKFIASTEDGTIAGWQSGTLATLRVDNSATNAIYKGLTIVPSNPQRIVAADFHNGKVAVFDATYQPVTPAAGAWTDPNIPAGYAPFNVAASGNQVFVAYAVQDANKKDDTAGAGNGAISVFDQSGTLVKTLVKNGGALNSPWAMVQVPAAGWGSLPAGALVVGNFGDGAINLFDATSGAQIATLAASGGGPLNVAGLWGLAFGKDTDAGETPSQLYFTAGPGDEAHGLFGYFTAQ